MIKVTYQVLRVWQAYRESECVDWVPHKTPKTPLLLKYVRDGGKLIISSRHHS
jgi:hypothetical protein